jgi:hypothetical protein
MARAFRRGLTPRRAAAIGAVVVVGLLTKLNFIGLIPGIVLGVVVLVIRVKRPSRATVYRGLATAVTATIAVALAAIVAGAIGSSAFKSPAKTISSITQHGSLLGRADYLWQFFLPRLPGMPSDFPGIFTTRQIWFNGLVGLYGWLDTTFPAWVYDAALVPAIGLALLCGRTVIARRSALARRRGELASYALMAAGLLVLVGSASYTGFPQIAGAYAESRYLLPLLALMGAALALAVRGAGRRWGPTVGVLILVLFLAHDVFSQLQVIARYYG